MLNFNYSIAADGKGGQVVYPPFVTQAGLDALNNRFVVREDDVFIVTYPKAGTNWMRQIVYLLGHGGVQGEQTLRETVPLLEKEASRDNWAVLDYHGERRYFMSHLPYCLMPGAAQRQARYICVARNPKDCATSYYYFMVSREDMRLQNEWDEFFTAYLQGLVPYGSWFDRTLEWWQASQQTDHILFVAYEEMQQDLAAIVEKVAEFIDIPLTPALRDSVVAQSTFAAMATNPKTNWNLNPTRNGFPDKHLRKGTVGDWQHRFTPEQNALFDALYQQKMQGTGLYFAFKLERA